MADRTKDYHMRYLQLFDPQMEGDQFPHENLRAFANFVLAVCPNMKLLHIQ